MKRNYSGKLVLADGNEYPGFLFGSKKEVMAELVFNTSMAGYQEIISDPSYTYQAVVMTYPLMGNYGINDDDYESTGPKLSALVVREFNDHPSNFRCKYTLDEVLKNADVTGISGIDTRMLTRHIRNYGSCKAIITSIDKDHEECMDLLEKYEIPHNGVDLVSTKKIVESPGIRHDLRVVAIDCGMKSNIVRSLNARGCDCIIVPWDTDAKTIESYDPDGIFISNGPGDPQDAVATINTIRDLIGKYPMFGICLGHQIISLAYGARTYKLKFGHRGGNHPVKDLVTGKVEITSQNHSFAVERRSLAGIPLVVTHVNILDNTIEGLRGTKEPVFSVQYHPESAPGPEDSGYLFDKFIAMMKNPNKLI